MQDSLQINVEKYDWQTIAIKKIQKEIFGEQQALSTIHSTYKRETKLVVVYGPPQIGKTTLILFLLGVNYKSKYNNSSKNIYDLLRGSSSYGNSSTSTAILYEQSKDNFFYIDDEIAKTSEELIELIDKMRNAVEDNSFKKDIIHIAIPKNAFHPDIKEIVSDVRYLDMPGVDSKNLAEKAHVDSIYRQYLGLATTILIVCDSHKIQSLSTIAEDSRKKLSPHWESKNRYIIVTVKSFSEASIIENYFFKSHKENNFYEYIKNKYSELIHDQELLPDCKVSIYSFDIGTSIDSLKKKISSTDFSECEEANKLMAESLRLEIQRQKGNAFSGTIEDLKTNIEENIGKDIDDITREINKLAQKVEKKEKNEKKRNKRLEDISKKINNLNNQIKEITEFYNSIDVKLIRNLFVNYKEDSFIKKVCDCIGYEVRGKKTGLREYFSHGIRYNEQKMKDELKRKVYVIQNEIIEGIRIDTIDNYDRDADFKNNILNYIEINELKEVFNNIQYPQIDISDFSKKTRMQYLENLMQKAIEHEHRCIMNVLMSFKNIVYSDLQKQESMVEKLRQYEYKLTSRLSDNEKSIREIQAKINELKNKKYELEQKKYENLSYLDSYRKIGSGIFLKCKKQMITAINNCKDKKNKLFLALYLGAKEEEYRKFKMEL